MSYGENIQVLRHIRKQCLDIYIYRRYMYIDRSYLHLNFAHSSGSKTIL